MKTTNPLTAALAKIEAAYLNGKLTRREADKRATALKRAAGAK